MTGESYFKVNPPIYRVFAAFLLSTSFKSKEFALYFPVHNQGGKNPNKNEVEILLKAEWLKAKKKVK